MDDHDAKKNHFLNPLIGFFCLTLWTLQGIADNQWVFTGIVHNEQGDRYGYFFRILKHQKELQATVAVVDSHGTQVLFYDKSKFNEAVDADFWEVERAFLRFNPINNSWIFGLKNKDSQGFNFKIDMLESDAKAQVKTLKPGIKLRMMQTNHLNGHLQVGNRNEEQFVTAEKTWFQQLWSVDETNTSTFLSEVMCDFEDGSGFFSMKLPDKEAINGSLALWRNKEGTSCKVSQFIQVNQEKDGSWYVDWPMPKRHLAFLNSIKSGPLVAGFLSTHEMPGFCTFSQHAIG